MKTLKSVALKDKDDNIPLSLANTIIKTAYTRANLLEQENIKLRKKIKELELKLRQYDISAMTEEGKVEFAWYHYNADLKPKKEELAHHPRLDLYIEEFNEKFGTDLNADEMREKYVYNK